MREKHSVKETKVNSTSRITVTNEEIPVSGNGFYNNKRNSDQNTNIYSSSLSSNKVTERWKAMDYEKYFNKYRKNGLATENDLMNSSFRSESSLGSGFSSNLNLSSFDDKDRRPGYVIRFYQRFAPDYWNFFPKTDFTYYPTSLFYKKQYAPGIPVVPNLSRRPIRDKYGTSQLYLQSSVNSETEQDCVFRTPDATSTNHKMYKRNGPIYEGNHCRRSLFTYERRTSWFRRTYETIKTSIFTTVTKSVTTTTETVIHPMRKPFISFPILFLLFALLFYTIFYFTNSELQKNEGIINTGVPWMPLSWLPSTHTSNATLLADISTLITKPFIWSYKLIGACLHFLSTSLFMIPTILSQLVQSLNTCLIIFFQRITGWTSQEPALRILNGRKSGLKNPSAERSTIAVDSEEIRKIVIDVLSERDLTMTGEIQRSTNGQMKTLNEFIIKITEKLATLENLSNEQKQAMVDIFPRSKSLEEKLSSTMDVDSGQSAVAGWPEVRENVVHVVKSMIKQYHADRTGIPDYALMSNGGTILSVRCTQTYTRDSGNVYLFGFHIWDVHSNPDVIIKPGILPGECWAFEGAEGYVAINLAMPIFISGFTMEHTPKELTPHGNIKSAPYQFSVWALKEVMDEKPDFLGRFKFLDNGESLQYFDAEKLDIPVQMVELRIESNHGSINYTCLYRFRVHGTPA